MKNPRRALLALACCLALTLPAMLQATEEVPRIIPMLNGPAPAESDLDAWFRSMHAWGVRQWMAYLLTTYIQRPRPGFPVSPDVPFIAAALPEFNPYLDSSDVRSQEETLRREERLSAKNRLEFWCNLPFPIFPVREARVLQKVEPGLFASGKFNLYDPRLPGILRGEVRALKTALPSLRGINVWISEGAGGVEITREDLRRNREWERPLIAAFNDETKTLGIQGIVFAHHFLHTIGTQRSVLEMMGEFPRLVDMEDATWPEEDMLHPFLGYLPPPDQALLFRNNPVAINILTETEYTGQGVLPSVYPRWWKYCVDESVRRGAKIAMGRMFMWDQGRSDVNFNRLNAYLFTRLCYDPAADPRRLLTQAAREMFGPRIPDRLVEILWQTEPVMKHIIGVNGVDPLEISRFPSPEEIDAKYRQRTPMREMNDLFSPPGTVLYPALTDELVNAQQWRWQNRVVARPAADYLEEKRHAVDWVRAVEPEVNRLAAALEPKHRQLFTTAYAYMDSLAEGMELFTETAAVHYDWARAKTLDDAAARTRFEDLAGRWQALAARSPENSFLYPERMLAFARFLRARVPK